MVSGEKGNGKGKGKGKGNGKGFNAVGAAVARWARWMAKALTRSSRREPSFAKEGDAEMRDAPVASGISNLVFH
jgi:hypothetical protein